MRKAASILHLFKIGCMHLAKGSLNPAEETTARMNSNKNRHKRVALNVKNIALTSLHDTDSLISLCAQFNMPIAAAAAELAGVTPTRIWKRFSHQPMRTTRYAYRGQERAVRRRRSHMHFETPLKNEPAAKACLGKDGDFCQRAMVHSMHQGTSAQTSESKAPAKSQKNKCNWPTKECELKDSNMTRRVKTITRRIPNAATSRQ